MITDDPLLFICPNAPHVRVVARPSNISVISDCGTYPLRQPDWPWSTALKCWKFNHAEHQCQDPLIRTLTGEIAVQSTRWLRSLLMKRNYRSAPK